MEHEILGQILAELKNLNVRQNSMAEELVAFQEFTTQKFEKLENRFDGLENEQKRLHVILENEIRLSIQMLAEGHAQMQAQLDRIEERVTDHDEMIFKRVK